jgi:hypothetical protein
LLGFKILLPHRLIFLRVKYLLAVSDGNDPKDPSARAQDKNKSLIRRMGIFN